MRFLCSLLVGCLSLSLAPHVASSSSMETLSLQSDSSSKLITLPLSRRHMSTQAIADELEGRNYNTKQFSNRFHSMENPPLAGCPQMDFTTPVTIAGTTYQLIVDTGSSSLAVSGQQCTTCPLPQYPLASETANAVQGAAVATAKFGDGTGWSGTVVQDSVSLSASANIPVKFVAIDSQSNGFFRAGTCANPKSTTTFATQGIIGFAYQSLAVSTTNTFFGQLVAATGIPNMFSMMECYLTGSMTLGGVTPGQASGLFYYTPIIQKAWYVVELQNMLLGGQSLGLSAATFRSTSPNNAIVDSGTSLMIIPATAYTALLTALNANAAFNTAFTTTQTPSPATTLMQGFCIPLANGLKGQAAINSLNANLPTLNLQMGGGFTLNLSPATGYLLPFDSTSKLFCLGFASGTSTILGWPLVNQFVVVYDVANSQIGFATQTGCNNQAGGTITATTAVGQPAPAGNTAITNPTTPTSTTTTTTTTTRAPATPTPTPASTTTTTATVPPPSTIMNCPAGRFGPGCALVYDLLGCTIGLPFSTVATTGYNGNSFVKQFATDIGMGAGTNATNVMVTQILAHGTTGVKVIFALFGTSVANLKAEEAMLVKNFKAAAASLVQQQMFGTLDIAAQAGLTLEDGAGSGSTTLGTDGPMTTDPNATPATTTMNNLPIIIGAAAGGAVLILLVAGTIIYRRRKSAATTVNVQHSNKNAGWAV